MDLGISSIISPVTETISSAIDLCENKLVKMQSDVEYAQLSLSLQRKGLSAEIRAFRDSNSKLGDEIMSLKRWFYFVLYVFKCIYKLIIFLA